MHQLTWEVPERFETKFIDSDFLAGFVAATIVAIAKHRIFLLEIERNYETNYIKKTYFFLSKDLHTASHLIGQENSLIHEDNFLWTILSIISHIDKPLWRCFFFHGHISARLSEDHPRSGLIYDHVFLPLIRSDIILPNATMGISVKKRSFCNIWNDFFAKLERSMTFRYKEALIFRIYDVRAADLRIFRHGAGAVSSRSAENAVFTRKNRK